jgi:hypothetical protein
MKLSIRTLYLYLFSFVGLLIIVFGSISMINIGLKTYVFKEADKYEIYLGPGEANPDGTLATKEDIVIRQDRELTRQRQRDLSNALAMLAVGIPLYMYHWKTLQKEGKEK